MLRLADKGPFVLRDSTHALSKWSWRFERGERHNMPYNTHDGLLNLSDPRCSVPKASMAWPEEVKIEELRQRMGLVLQKRSGESMLGKATKSVETWLALDSGDADAGRNSIEQFCTSCKDVQGITWPPEGLQLMVSLWDKLAQCIPEYLSSRPRFLTSCLRALEALQLHLENSDSRVETIKHLQAMVSLTEAAGALASEESMAVTWLGESREEKLAALMRALQQVAGLEEKECCKVPLSKLVMELKMVKDSIEKHIFGELKAKLTSTTATLKKSAGCARAAGDWDVDVNWREADWASLAAHAPQSLLAFDVKGMVKLILSVEEVSAANLP